eukprot:GHVL01003555.1.p1 GENE.GHVL01003555.1~~GHVL01003555.1.p1  ORF type:complete len:536 (+),score=99.28 GHVL01003555.1:113-1720(+)
MKNHHKRKKISRIKEFVRFRSVFKALELSFKCRLALANKYRYMAKAQPSEMIGRSTDLCKPYFRLVGESCSTVDPCTVRPPPILEKAVLHHLERFNKNEDRAFKALIEHLRHLQILSEEIQCDSSQKGHQPNVSLCVYLFFRENLKNFWIKDSCDQFKSIRQDILLQNLIEPVVISAYKTSAVLSLKCGDKRELSSSLSFLADVNRNPHGDASFYSNLKNMFHSFSTLSGRSSPPLLDGGWDEYKMSPSLPALRRAIQLGNWQWFWNTLYDCLEHHINQLTTQKENNIKSELSHSWQMCVVHLFLLVEDEVRCRALRSLFKSCLNINLATAGRLIGFWSLKNNYIPHAADSWRCIHRFVKSTDLIIIWKKDKSPIEQLQIILHNTTNNNEINIIKKMLKELTSNEEIQNFEENNDKIRKSFFKNTPPNKNIEKKEEQNGLLPTPKKNTRGQRRAKKKENINNCINNENINNPINNEKLNNCTNNENICTKPVGDILCSNKFSKSFHTCIFESLKCMLVDCRASYFQETQDTTDLS